MSGHRLSIAMIVRDEAQHIAGCIEGVAPVAAQIVVVDTGSVDDTPDIARALGAEVHTFSWCSDFSAARNFSIDLCTCPWIFVIDADERVAPEDRPTLASYAAGPPTLAYRFMTRNYTDQRHLTEFTPCYPDDPHAHGFPGWFPSIKARLFPNRPDIRFRGEVHEMVNPAIENLGMEIQDTAMPVHHYPLEKPAKRLDEKRELYLALGIDKTRREPENARAWEELAEQYIELNQIGEAAAAYRQAVALAPGDARLLSGLGSVLAIAGHNGHAATALDLALRADPANAQALRNRAFLHMRDNEPAGAEPLLRRALEARGMDAELRRFLAIALDEQGRTAEALAEARLAALIDPANEQAAALEADLAERLD